MTCQLQQITEFLSEFAPLALAESWDNVGLLLGDEQSEIRNVLTCLTLTIDVAEEAVQEDAQLIISHHPILFRPVQYPLSSSLSWSLSEWRRRLLSSSSVSPSCGG